MIVPVAGSAAAPLLDTLGSVDSGSPLGAIGGVTGSVANTVGSLPVLGGGTAPVTGVAPAGSSILPDPYALESEIPGTYPVNGLSISIITCLLSLLKKVPLPLFGGLGGAGIPTLKRKIPEQANTFSIQQLASPPSPSPALPLRLPQASP
ncbi:hypothetical protein BU23DRAFT_554823 [Bimuria novae-zelandiae CBS 107.79]|uniref:Uncharacterized protein n=1 Tax=Bimuria novae-zelandiae CBS 107.79 TaxID=1447943 RepID=A0A6A5V785_9PLEO|nr:hypothetical protein BU23DRAFT_554823 [Bimuria novae-zelandiae CBS 107.79]